MVAKLKAWLLRRLGLRRGYILLPSGASLTGPCRIEGYGLKVVGTHPSGAVVDRP